ncbi:MAG: CDP-alcohol phosphatidyltransferase family protein [Candidatus Geothermincolia bacterium]
MSESGMVVEPPAAGEEAPAEVETDDDLTRGQKREAGMRWFADFIFRPFLWLFGGVGLSPNVLTILGMASAVVCGYFLAVGNVPLAAVFFVLSGVLDLVDGYVAKKLDKITVFGSFLDSFSDRVSDAAIYLGIAVLYLRRGEGIYVGLAFVLLVTSFLISYTRAKAEALGVTCKAGLMARAPRFLALGVGLFFNGLSPWVLRSVLWIVAILSVETLVARLIEVWKVLDK